MGVVERLQACSGDGTTDVLCERSYGGLVEG